MSNNDLQILIQNVADILNKQQWHLATSESCTGGWLSKCCTDLSGSSTWFDRGFVTYSNKSKQDLLNVSLATLEQHGAVSEQTAIEMAQGALDNSDANISVAITGIAGPDGGTVEKPVGTVWLAWSIKNGATKSEHIHLSGDREQIRYQAVIAALQGIVKNARD
ncbi:damage-inducible protein CinA [Methylophaga sp. 42_25_T18]|nr:damage-inducible protein CinA [Methylophaga sp. 42_25_T18]OUR85341.1 damage-inducible protein CinA [Methylophaga sp. 42_8_T64]